MFAFPLNFRSQPELLIIKRVSQQTFNSIEKINEFIFNKPIKKSQNKFQLFGFLKIFFSSNSATIASKGEKSEYDLGEQTIYMQEYFNF